ncbi:MAG: LuxR C-terminal-related transcriptional regulator [Nitrospinae bacterium]|nr:LuxR C-terminal-related transcriptional regulator [Nitrospinota bacterium]
MGEREAFEHILASLHEAALDDTHWSTASALIDEALRVHGNSMAVVDLQSGKDILFFFLGIFSHGHRHHEFEREYFDVYYPLDERVPRVRQFPDSQLVHVSELYTEKELKTSVVYNDYLNRLEARNCINVRLDGPDGSSIAWIVHDPVDGSGWSSARLDSIRCLLPHIRQYVSFRQALSGAGALGASLMELLDTTGSGIIQLDRRGRIVEVNDRARDLLRAGDGLFDERGFLFARTPEENDHLQGLLARALPPFGAQGVGGSIMVRRASALPLVLHVNPVDWQSADFSVWPVAALMLVVDSAGRTRIDPALAGAVLGLTEMESQVAMMLAEGMSVGNIAVATDRKESTIRWHVRNMFAKLGLSRQTDLVRLLLPLAGVPESQERRRNQP